MRLVVAIVVVAVAAIAAGAAVIPLAGWAVLVVGLLTLVPILARPHDEEQS